MLERALVIVLLALLPLALARLPIADHVVWRSCGAIVFFASPTLSWSLI